MSNSTNAAEVMRSPAYRYAEDVLSGKVLACQSIMDAAQRFLTDLRAAEKPGARWRFDLTLGERPVRFTEQFLAPGTGNYERMQLMGWQQFVDVQAFGWVSADNGYRRFREVLEFVARGNGKTTRVAGKCAYMTSKDGERGARNYIAANGRVQADRFLKEVGDQIESSKALDTHFDVRKKVIRYPASNSTLETLANDSMLLAGLVPHFVVKEELHAERSFDQINQIRRAFKKRRQPLMWYPTSAGVVLDGPLIYYYNMTKRILRPQDYREDERVDEQVADRFLGILYELDSVDEIDDPQMWVKANPALGVLLELDDLIYDWERCKNIPAERADFVTSQLNIFANASDALFVERDLIDGCAQVFDEHALVGRGCWGGFDLSNTEDLTAAALEFDLPGSKTAIITHTWIPQERVDKGDLKGVDWYSAAMQGLVDIVPGKYVDYELVIAWFVQMRKCGFRIRSIGYDPANAPLMVRRLAAEGFTCHVVRQGALTLNAPMKDIRQMILDGKLMAGYDEVFLWYLRNVKLRRDFFDQEKENWVPTKRDRLKKIDGFMAFLFAHTERIRSQPVVGDRYRESRIITMQLPKREI